MTHEKEIKFWAEHKNGTKVWTKFDNTGWKLEAFPCWISANMYIVDDEWAELRKANADGYTIQQKGKVKHTMPDNWWNVGFYDTAFCTFSPEDFCIKPKEWYECIPPEGIPCWVWDDDHKQRLIAVINRYEENANYKFWDISDYFWKNAVPVKPEECWQGECK